MNSIRISSDIIPIGELKKRLSQCLKSIRSTGHPLIITQNGRPAGVLISPAEYDELVQKKAFIESVSRGLSDIDSDNVYSTKELKEELLGEEFTFLGRSRKNVLFNRDEFVINDCDKISADDVIKMYSKEK